MKTQIKINENLILHYEDGFLCCIEKPISKIEININKNGSKSWYKNGKHHRDEDLPAIEYADGSKYWYKNGLRHRDGDLPAIERSDGSKEWFENGYFIRSER